MNLNYRAYVGVYSPTGALLYRASSTQAETIVRDGGSVYSLQGGKVTAIKMTEAQVLRGGGDTLKPGSFGIFENHLPSGHTCFQHKRTWGEELGAAA